MKMLSCCLAGTLLLSTAAFSQVPPPATYSIFGLVGSATPGGPSNSQNYMGPLSATSHNSIDVVACDVLMAEVCGHAVGFVAPDLEMQMNAGSPNSEFGVNANATLTYYFTVVSPNNIQTRVPLLFSGFLGATSSGNAESQAFIDTNAAIFNGQGFVQVCSAQGAPAGSGCPFSSGKFFNYAFAVPSGDVFTIQEGLDGAVGTPTIAEGGFTALVDPIITIDPTWLATHPGYSLEFSSNITQPSGIGVPEPGTLSLLALALAGLGMTARRKVT